MSYAPINNDDGRLSNYRPSFYRPFYRIVLYKLNQSPNETLSQRVYCVMENSNTISGYSNEFHYEQFLYNEAFSTDGYEN